MAIISHQQAEARQRRMGGATLKELADSYNVSKATILRLSRAVILPVGKAIRLCHVI
jgi:hypothetical protein